MTTITGFAGAPDKKYLKHTWETLGTGDDGSPITVAHCSQICIQATGDFSAGAGIHIDGSNDGGTTWVQLQDVEGAAINLTSAGLKDVLEHPELIRPSVTNGNASTDIDVFLVAKFDN